MGANKDRRVMTEVDLERSFTHSRGDPDTVPPSNRPKFRDKTHSFGCWKWHHECALARIEQLEKTLGYIKKLSLDGMNMTKEFNTGLQFNQIIFEAERMDEKA